MVPKLKIHFWNISGYVNIDPTSKKVILKKILEKDSLNNFSKKLKISGVGLSNFLYNKDSFIRISNLVDIINNLNISKYFMERKIIGYKDTSSKGLFQINFPYYISPIDIRIGGVLFGDGNIHKISGAIRWIQKDPLPLLKLLKKHLKKNIKLSIKDNQITIPSFFKKILCCSLNLNPSELNNKKFVEQILKLPKKYSLALLIAIIEDEGNIDSKNYGAINIRMASKEKIYSIKNLCDYLSYNTSLITSYKNRGTFGINKMFKIKILSDGIKKLGYDLIKLQKNYGKEIGLWKKEVYFIERWKSCTSQRSRKNKEGKGIHQKITELLLKSESISPSTVSKLLNINYDRIYNLMKNMNKRKEIIKIARGFYKLKK